MNDITVFQKYAGLKKIEFVLHIQKSSLILILNSKLNISLLARSLMTRGDICRK